MLEVRYVKEDELEQVKKLYEEVFEDTEAFRKYFYEEELIMSQVMGGFLGENLVAMVMLREKNVVIDKKEKLGCYLYGIATATEHRNKGYMRKVMDEVLKMAYGHPYEFIYLVPACTEMYEKMGFKLLRKGEKQILDETVVRLDTDCLIAKAGAINAPLLSVFTAEVEDKKKGIAIKKSQLYFEKRILQAEAENAGVYIVRDMFDISPKAVVITGTSMGDEICVVDVICEGDEEMYAIELTSRLKEVAPYITKLPIMYYDKTNSMNLDNKEVRLNDEV